MATLLKGSLGDPSGKIGQLVYRRRRGKVFIYTAPLPFESSKAPASIASRKKFTFLRKMAAGVNKDFLLKTLWNESTLPGGIGYERLMSVNSKIENGSMDISKLKLVPSDDLIHAEIQTIVQEEGQIILTIVPLNNDLIKEYNHPEVSVHGVMLYKDKVNNLSDKYPYLFHSLTSPAVEFRNNEPLVFSIKTEPEINYLTKEFAICLVVMDNHALPAFFSINLYAGLDN